MSTLAEHDETSRFDQSRHVGRRAVTLRSVGDAIRRRWIVVAAVALVVFALALGTSLMLTPKYDAFAKVRITPNAASPLDFGNGTEQPADQTAVNTEVQVIGSRATARKVVTQLGLDRDPEFTGKGPANTAIERATSGVLDHLKINRDDKSYLVLIGIRSVDGAKAARIANTYASTYVAGTADNLMGTAAKQSQSIQNRLRELGAEVQTADARLASYRAQSGISQSGEGGTITDQQIAPLSMQLATAESEAAAARSALSVAERQNATGGTDAISAVLSSGVIADLRRQRTEAEKRRAELSSRYGPRYPLRIHHRASSLPSVAAHPARIGCKAGAAYYASPAPNPNLLVGAVVGGPSNSTDAFPDARAVFQQSEPTTYINAPLMGLLAYFSAHPNPAESGGD